MHTRTLGSGAHGLEVSAIGLGCMGMSQSYGPNPGDRQAMIGVLRDAGFSRMEAATLQCRLERFAFALVLLETNVATPSGNPLQKARSAEARAFLATLPAAEFPHVCEAEEWLCNAVDPEWAFEFTLDLIIGGLEKLLERRPRGSDGEPVDESPPPPS